MVTQETPEELLRRFSDWEGMPSPQKHALLESVRSVEASQRRMERIDRMERVTYLLVACFLAGVAFLAVTESCSKKQDVATVSEAQP